MSKKRRNPEETTYDPNSVPWICPLCGEELTVYNRPDHLLNHD